MAGLRPRVRPVVRLAAAIALAIGSIATPGLPVSPVAPPARAAELPAWTGEVDLYRDGVFTTQQSWLWCTAAGIQIVRNIVAGEDDHSTASQRRYFEWMRGRNRYDLPESAGVDPQGWTAGLRRFVDERYRLTASATFEGALRLAVTRIRLTRLPVALTVSHGGHGWILHGFAATADPARTEDFAVTSVRVTGPLYGLQSRNGYDMPPDTTLTTAQLRRFFTPWRYDPLPMIWDGKYVSIQPVPESTAPAPSATPPAPSENPSPNPSIPASPSPPPDPSPSPSPSPAPSAAPTPPSPAPVAAVPATPRPSPLAVAGAPTATGPPSAPTASTTPPGASIVFALGVGALAALLVILVRRRASP